MTLRKRTLRAGLGLMMVAGLGRAGGGQIGAAAMAPPSTSVFPLEQVRAGLKGVAYTVFEGTRPEPMEVEILGRLKNALGPGRDLILARLHGSKPEYTGVVAGMSGSPVYVDGKLLGALSYRIGQFSKEPIAGITPIEQMLEVSRGAEAGRPAEGAATGEAGMDLRPMEAPLVFGGFSQEAITRFGGAFRSMGLLPVAGLGSMDTTKHQAEPLEPGSAVSAVLVDGDLSITGTCTVSYVDQSRLMACGHPLTQAGHVNLPMAKAEVLATLASPLNAFKIVNATEIVGAFTEDRSSAIFGHVGARAEMIPVSIQLTAGGDRPPKIMHLSVANHRELTPQLMMASIYQSLQQLQTGSSETSYKLSGEIRLSVRDTPGIAGGAAAVKIDGWETQAGFNPGAVNAALAVGERFTQLFANPQQQPRLLGVELKVESSDRRRSASLEAARITAPEARAGETIEVEAELRPYQRPAEVRRLRVTLPRTLESGLLRLLVSDGATLDRLLDAGATHAAGLADTIARLNRMHANDRVYVTLLDRSAQAVLDAAALRDLPLSMANVLEPLKGTQRVRLSGESAVELGSMPAEDEVSGSQVLSLAIR